MLGNKPEKILPLLGNNKRTAVIANAQDTKPADRRSERVCQEIDALTSLGLQLEEIDLRDYFGKPTELKKELKKFGFIWARGGNGFVLRRAFYESGLDNLLISLLQEDKIVYGGFSAGICVLSPSLRGVDLVDSTDDVLDGYDKKVIWEGLGLLKYAIAPHYKSDHPESEDIDKCVEYFKTNNIPYKTLRDGDAIVINGDSEEIIS